MHSECRMVFAVLALRPLTSAICQDRLQPVEVRAHHVQALVGDQPSQILPHPLPHHARLAMVCCEPLFEQNRSDLRCKALDTSFESILARERKIIGVACVGCSDRFGQTAQAAIQAIGGQVGQRRRHHSPYTKGNLGL